MVSPRRTRTCRLLMPVIFGVALKMTRKQLERLVRERFGLDLPEFLKQKIAIEGLYDYEIAALLKIRPVRIGKLRKEFGIERSNGFKRRATTSSSIRRASGTWSVLRSRTWRSGWLDIGSAAFSAR